MNKELEEFKKEMEQKLNSILINSMTTNGVLKNLKDLIKKLKPKPEFIEGEVVLVSDNGERWVSAVFDYNCDGRGEYKFLCSELPWKGCKKTEALPMNMTKYDGTNKPSNEKIVFIKCKSDSMYEFDGGRSEDIDWDGAEAFQVLKDLNP